MSDLKPSTVKKTIAAIAIEMQTANNQTVDNDLAGPVESEVNFLISSLVSILFLTKSPRDRRQAAMEGHPYRRFAHAQPLCCFAD